MPMMPSPKPSLNSPPEAPIATLKWNSRTGASSYSTLASSAGATLTAALG